MSQTLEFKWGISRGRDTYGYNICTLYVNGRKVSSCNGGGYDMEGTCLGEFIARRYADRLQTLKVHRATGYKDGRLYGLSYHDPNYDPGKAVIDGETVEEREKAEKSVGLERYQEFYRASSYIPTKTHTVPLIDGACGMSSVQRIMEAIRLKLEYVPVKSKNLTIYRLIDEVDKESPAEIGRYRK